MNFMAAGSLLYVPTNEREGLGFSIDSLIDELPSLMGKKRVMGEAPPSEVYITRKLLFYRAKHARWITAGRVKENESKWWQVIRISPVEELALFWNAHARAPKPALESLIARLSSFSPPPRPDTKRKNKSLATSQATTDPSKSNGDDLDTLEEIVIRSLLLGTCYLALKQLKNAKHFLTEAATLAGGTEDVFVAAYARYGLALVELKTADEADPKQKRKKTLWEPALVRAQAELEEVYKLNPEHYNMRSRLESRVGIVLEEIAAKRSALL